MEEFSTRYNDAEVKYIDPVNGPTTQMPDGVTIDSKNPADVNTSTELANILITNKAKFGEKTFTLTYPAKNRKQDPNIVITLDYNIEHDLSHMPALNPDYLIAGADQTVQVKGREVAGAWKLEAE